MSNAKKFIARFAIAWGIFAAGVAVCIAMSFVGAKFLHWASGYIGDVGAITVFMLAIAGIVALYVAAKT